MGTLFGGIGLLWVYLQELYLILASSCLFLQALLPQWTEPSKTK